MVSSTVDQDQVLLDAELDGRLARDGLVSTPVVDPALLAPIEAAYWEIVPSGETGIVLDYLRADRVLARRLADLFEPIWDDVVPQLFAHHYPVYTSFVVKHPGEGSSLFLHRDLCVDDERVRRTFSMWMPLVDTSPELDNGPLAFVPGSHHIRYGAFGPNAVGTFSPYEDHLRAHLEPMAVPAGTALIYDARMLHASAPNRSDRPRVAVGCLLARRDQPVVQVMATGRRHRVLHEVDRDYFLDQAPADIAEQGMPDRYRVLDEFDEQPPVSTEAVLGAFGANDGPPRRVIVPGDLEAVAVERRRLAPCRTAVLGHHHDLALTAAVLEEVPNRLAGGVEAEVTGGGAVGVRELTAGWRRRGVPPEAVADDILPRGGPAVRDAALVVLDPGARLVLLAPRRRVRHHELVVVECPAVRSGIASGGGVAELEPGAVFELPPHRRLHVWNDGPGPLVLVVRARLGRPRAEPETGAADAAPS